MEADGAGFKVGEDGNHGHILHAIKRGASECISFTLEQSQLKLTTTVRADDKVRGVC